MSGLILPLLLMLIMLQPVQAQSFDAARGYIFAQSYVTRITPAQAETMLAGAKDLARWRDYAWLEKHQEQLPADVKRQGKYLIFRAGAQPPLSLKSYTYRGQSDAGDSQKFSYLQTLTRYHLVGVEFSHDEPHFLLIERSNLRVYFINTVEPGQ